MRPSGRLRRALARARLLGGLGFLTLGCTYGPVEERGTIGVPGGEVNKRELVFEDKLKVLLYSATVGDLVLSARLDDIVNLPYRSKELPEDLQDQADQIMGSLEVQ